MSPLKKNPAERPGSGKKPMWMPETTVDGSIRCPRCNGKMTTEWFQSNGDIFPGARCVICGDILDPVILLHRVSGNAQITIPDGDEAIMLLVKKYVEGGPIPVQHQRKKKRTRRGLTKNLSRDPVHKSFT